GIHKAGHIIDVNVIVSTIRDESGNPIGNARIVRDTTYQRSLTKTELAQLASSAMVQPPDDATVGKNLDGIIPSWNRGAERLFGYTPDEIVGKPVSVLIPAGRPNGERG